MMVFARAVRWIRRRSRGRGDAGSVPLEWVILAPIVFLLIFGAVQAGLYFHARQVAHQAADQGIQAGRALNAPTDAGPAAARDFLQRMGNSLASPGVSSAGTTAEEIHIEVTGEVTTLIPGVSLKVVARAQAPIERWVE